MTWLKAFWARLRGKKQPSQAVTTSNVSSRAENFTQMRAKRSERSYMREDSKSSQHADDFFLPLMASAPHSTGYADLTPLFRGSSSSGSSDSGESYSPASSSTYQVESAKSDYCSSDSSYSSYDSGSSYSSSSSDSCSSSSSSSSFD